MHITSETVEQCNANQLRKVTYKNTASNDWNTDRAGQYQLDAVSARFLQDHEVTDRDRLVIALRELAKDGYDVERRPVDWTKAQMICSLGDSESEAFGPPRESRRQLRFDRMATRACLSEDDYWRLFELYPADVMWNTNPEESLQEPYRFTFKGYADLVECVFQAVGFKTRLFLSTPDDGSETHYEIAVAPSTMVVR